LRDPDIDIVDISGRLSFGNTLKSVERSILNLVEQGSRRSIVNLSGLDFVDSAGVGMLIGCSAQMERVAALDADVDTATGNLTAKGTSGAA
jgi:anti-anti-sigma factor